MTEQPDLLSGDGTNAFPAQLNRVQKPSLFTAKNQGLWVEQMPQLHTLETTGELRHRHSWKQKLKTGKKNNLFIEKYNDQKNSILWLKQKPM